MEHTEHAEDGDGSMRGMHAVEALPPLESMAAPLAELRARIDRIRALCGGHERFLELPSLRHLAGRFAARCGLTGNW